MSFIYVLATLFTFATPNAAAARVPVVQEKDSVARVIDRLQLSKANFSILNRKKVAALLLLDKTIVLQMTDAGLDELGREMKKENSEKPSGMPKLLEKIVMSSVKALLDHGIEYQLSDLGEARVENGVLVLESKSGDRIFDETKINDEPVLATFAEADARRFAQLVNRAKHKH